MNLKGAIKSLVKDMVDELIKACKSTAYMTIEQGILGDAFGVDIGTSLVVVLGSWIFREHWEFNEPRQSLRTYLSRCAVSFLLLTIGLYLWSLLGGTEKLIHFALLVAGSPDTLFHSATSRFFRREKKRGEDFIEDIRFDEVVREAAEKSGMPRVLFEMLLFLITCSAVRCSAHIIKIFGAIFERRRFPRDLRERQE